MTELSAGRTVLQHLLSGIGNPYLALRIGVADTENAEIARPRRAADDSVDTESGNLDRTSFTHI